MKKKTLFLLFLLVPKYFTTDCNKVIDAFSCAYAAATSLLTKFSINEVWLDACALYTEAYVVAALKIAIQKVCTDMVKWLHTVTK